MTSSNNLLVELLQRLDAPQARICELERYSTGTQPLAFLSTDQKTALARFGRMASNIPRLAVTSLSERLRISGFDGADIWNDWVAQDLDQLSDVAHQEALTFGSSYVIVWGSNGKPQVSIESPKQVAVIRDPGSRQVLRAVKRWRNNIGGTAETLAVVYYPDRIERWHASQVAFTAGFNLVETLDNPIGVVPVVPINNTALLEGVGSDSGYMYDFGHSEISDLIPLCDGLNKLLTDMLVSAEYTARPRRWATGIELVERPKLDSDGNPVLDEDDNPVIETVNPIPEGSRAMISEASEAKFGQLQAADLTGYENAVNVLLGQIMAVSALPAHYIGVLHDNPSSADAIRSAEASLTARAEARQKTFGRAWEQVARLMVAVRDGADPADVNVRVQWCDPSTRSEAQEADAATKLFAAGILSRAGTLRRLGFTADEIRRELTDKRAELLSEDLYGSYVHSNDPRIALANEGLMNE
ncbi:Phage portal protein, SPP1 Gp6-like [Mycobacterium lentiflavum]|uniref:Phage portal protein, SPP1 Gp6-like n=1 Tax=Mycobacterium lentiflavum TaxID=141349 RepID=A0A0E4CMX4_MYCLN|nr:phage portal protein [Mycobacterium lentiflavum]CQD11891.1 Phage portal protein, SPP1 Gp6-like [Mycobacterium lentiflavum]